jgi:hypothetical protein
MGGASVNVETPLTMERRVESIGEWVLSIFMRTSPSHGKWVKENLKLGDS